MKYCPHCAAEYQERIAICADCDAPLISQQEFEKRKEEEERFHKETETLVKVFTLRDRFEADVISRELEKEGIPVLIRSFRDTAYDGIYIPQKGWGEVNVPAKEQARAKEIIDTLEQILAEGKVSISEEEDMIPCPCCGKELLVENKVCPHCNKPLGTDSGMADLE